MIVMQWHCYSASTSSISREKDTGVLSPIYLLLHIYNEARTLLPFLVHLWKRTPQSVSACVSSADFCFINSLSCTFLSCNLLHLKQEPFESWKSGFHNQPQHHTSVTATRSWRYTLTNGSLMNEVFNPFSKELKKGCFSIIIIFRGSGCMHGLLFVMC